MKKLFLTFALLETACFASEINHENLGTTNPATQNIEQNITTNSNLQENDIDKKLTNEFYNNIILEAISADRKMNIEQHMTKTQKVLDEILSFAKKSNNISETLTNAFSKSLETIFNPKSDYDNYKLKGKLVNALLPKKKQIKFSDKNINKQNITNKINKKYDDLSAKVNFLIFHCYMENYIRNLKTIKDIEDIMENVIFYAESIKLFNEGIDSKVQRNEYKNINHLLVLYAGLRSEYANKIMQSMGSQNSQYLNFIEKKYYLNIITYQLYCFVFWSETFLHYTLLHNHETDYTQEHYNAFMSNVILNLYNENKEGTYYDQFGIDGDTCTYSYLLCYDFNTHENSILPSTDFCNINDDNIDDNTSYFTHKLYTTFIKISEINKKINELYAKIHKKQVDEKQASKDIIDNIILKIGKIILEQLKTITNTVYAQTIQNPIQENVPPMVEYQNNQQTLQNPIQENFAPMPQYQNNPIQENVAPMPQYQNTPIQENVAPMPEYQNNTQYSISYDQLLAKYNQLTQRVQELTAANANLNNQLAISNNCIEAQSKTIQSLNELIKRLSESDREGQKRTRRNNN